MVEPLKIEGEKSIEIKRKLNEVISELDLLDKKVKTALEMQSVIGIITELRKEVERQAQQLSEQEILIEGLRNPPPPVPPRRPRIVTYADPPSNEEKLDWRPIGDGEQFWMPPPPSSAVSKSQVPPEIIEKWREKKLPKKNNE